MGTIFARAVACAQSLKFGGIICRTSCKNQNHCHRPSSTAGTAPKTMADHLKRMEAEAKAAQVSKAVQYVSVMMLFMALNFAYLVKYLRSQQNLEVIENDIDPNQALILANQNQPKAIKP
jgi:hypothetical protein